MKVITLYNPWASWVILGWKRIETRLHNRFACLKGEWIGIHAGLTWDGNAADAARKYLHAHDLFQSESFRKDCGKLLGIAHVSEARWLTEDDSPAALIDCKETRRFGLVFDHLEPWKPTPVRGHQGIWTWERP